MAKLSPFLACALMSIVLSSTVEAAPPLSHCPPCFCPVGLYDAHEQSAAGLLFASRAVCNNHSLTLGHCLLGDDVVDKELGECLAILITNVRSNDPEQLELARRASLVLAASGDRHVLAHLLKMVKDGHPLEVSHAAVLIASMGSSAEMAVPTLVELLRTYKGLDRLPIIHALGGTGSKANGVVQALQPLLRDRSAAVRVQAAAALWRVERRSSPVLPVLVRALQEPSREESHAIISAIQTLGEMGSSAKKAIPELRKYLAATEFELHSHAAEAIAAINPDKESIAVMLKWLGDSNSANAELRARAIRVLSKLPEHKKVVIQAAEEMMKEEGSYHRFCAISTIRYLPVPTDTKTELLVGALKDRDPFTRQVAAAELGLLGSQAKSSLSALRTLLKDEDKFVRWQAASALKTIERP